MTDESGGIVKPCEGCGKHASGGLWDYCEYCSEDLCPDCMRTQRCRQAPPGSCTAHLPSVDADLSEESLEGAGR